MAHSTREARLNATLTRGALGLAAALLLFPQGAAAQTATFSDVTAEAGLTSTWRSAGAAWGDYDGDGCVDLYVSGDDGLAGGTKQNHLYKNTCLASFVDVTAAAGVTGPDDGHGVTWVDYDNDGDLDLSVVSRSPDPMFLYRNNGNGTFTDVAAAAGFTQNDRSAGVSWADYDGDGDLDVYVAHRFELPCPDPGTDNTDRFYRNDGDGTFTEIGAELGIVGDSQRCTFMTAWVDFDGDFDLDAYVSVDFDDDVLYANNGDGTFTDVTAAAGITDPHHGMGLSVGDPNRDGCLDIISTNNAQEPDPGTHGPSILYRQNELGGPCVMTFVNANDNANILDRDVVEWGVNFVDYDNDGDDDLSIVAGGMLSGGEPNVLYINGGNGTGSGSMTEVTAEAGVEDSGGAFGSVWADYDNDGDLDWFVANETGSNKLFRNDGVAHSHLKVILDGVVTNDRGVGARVDVAAGGKNQVRIVQAGESYLSGEEPMVYFGLNENAQADTVTVSWPSGVIDQLAAVGADSTITVREGEAITNGIFFTESFDDGALNADWDYPRGEWSESDGEMVGVPDADVGTQIKARAFADPAFGGCGAGCEVWGKIAASNTFGLAAEIHVRLIGWFVDNQNNVSITLKPEQDKAVIRQKVDSVGFRQDIDFPLDQDVTYTARITFDGTDFDFYLNGNHLGSLANNAAGTPFGTVGVQSRNADAHVQEATAFDLD